MLGAFIVCAPTPGFATGSAGFVTGAPAGFATGARRGFNFWAMAMPPGMNAKL
jgi:hypothetical protein